MDPDANMREQREIAADLLAGRVPAEAMREKAERLAELVVALDSWLAAGGFAPTWQVANV